MTKTFQKCLCFATICSLSISALIIPSVISAKPKNSLTDAFTSSNISDAATVGEIWNGTQFNTANLNTLIKYVSNIEDASVENLTPIEDQVNQTQGKTAADMRASTAAGKASGKDIVVTFGGLTWTPTYLSKTKPNEKNENGDLILTLWLTDSAQLNGGTYDEGASKKFSSSGTATWNAGTNSADKPTDNYPDAMYGTSYMNAVVLNNGGFYKEKYNVDEVVEVRQSDAHVFSVFTSKKSPLREFLTTPSEVAWQEFGQDKRLYVDYTLPNENWSRTIDKNGTIEGDPTGTSYKFYSNNYNYASKEYSNQWSTSTLWLPSMSETGYSDTKIGIWQTSTAQRSNTTNSWLRSGYILHCSMLSP